MTLINSIINKRTLFLLLGFLIFSKSPISADDLSNIKTLDDCVKLGLETYEHLKLAEEEVELARKKRLEAYRGFYPALSVKAEETNGELNDLVSPDFSEEIYGATLSYDVIGGGRISSAYRQAVYSYQAAEHSREKKFHEYLFAVKEAYWNLVKSQVTLKERDQSLSIIKQDLKMITEQYVLDLAVKKQFLAVKAEYLQANQQLNEAKKNHAQSKWALAKALGLKRQPDFTVTEEIPFKKLEIQLDDCLRLASTHRPDLFLEKALLNEARAANRNAKSENWPALRLDGFYGKSGAAYEGEDLVLRDDWQINAKLSQRFLGNSLNLKGNRVKTSPKLGESSRTNTETRGVDLKILDHVKELTDMDRAELEYRKAKLKLQDLELDVAVEVENAYYDWNQSLLQVEFSSEDVKLAEEELKVAESNRKYGLAEVLEVAKSRNRYAQSQAARIAALSAYQVSLASLNRVIGVPEQFFVK